MTSMQTQNTRSDLILDQHEQEISRKIQALMMAGGPMDVGAYMNLCLAHPAYGYYMRKDPLGALGDFTTAPEISQMFGEIIGAWVAGEWGRLECPEKFHLVELGPGRGSLMSDILRIVKNVNSFFDAAQIHLVEISPALKEKQQEALKDYAVSWLENVQDIPADAPVIIVNNEFWDALPFRQFVYNGQSWDERKISYNQSSNACEWMLEPSKLIQGKQLERYPEPKAGDVLEVSAVRESIFEELTNRIKDQKGSMLCIDYGYDKPAYGDTFQALHKHTYVDVLQAQGCADLTNHVDFSVLSYIALKSGLRCSQIGTQAEFLKTCGIEVRAKQLSAIANEKQKQNIKSALHRLTHADEMGTLFKVMEVSES